MSRIGKKPIAIPAGVTVTLEGQTVAVKGPKGQLSWTVVDEIVVAHENGELTLSPRDESTRARAMWGLSRSLLGNMVHGVSQGYRIHRVVANRWQLVKTKGEWMIKTRTILPIDGSSEPLEILSQGLNDVLKSRQAEASPCMIGKKQNE